MYALCIHLPRRIGLVYTLVRGLETHLIDSSALLATRSLELIECILDRVEVLDFKGHTSTRTIACILEDDLHSTICWSGDIVLGACLDDGAISWWRRRWRRRHGVSLSAMEM